MKTTTRLQIVLAISFAFFIFEIAMGFRTKSLALIADAFHYLNDIVAYLIAYIASYVKSSGRNAPGFTFAFHRAELLGAFFNGVFLLALALSIFLQSLERFIQIEVVQDPFLVLIVGCVGLGTNILSALVIHEHGHGHNHGHEDEPQTELSTPAAEAVTVNTQEVVETIELEGIEEGDLHALHHHVRLPKLGEGHNAIGHNHANLGLLAVLVHLLGDACNNIGVIIAAVIMWKLSSPARFYADPATSMIISFVIFASAVPLTKRTSRILLEAAPADVDLDKVKEDLLTLPDVLSIHDLHIWYLSQSVILASFHVIVRPETSLTQWEEIEKSLRECLSAYGVNHVTVEPELYKPRSSESFETSTDYSDLRIKSACEDMGCTAGVNTVTLKSLRNRHNNANSPSH